MSVTSDWSCIHCFAALLFINKERQRQILAHFYPQTPENTINREVSNFTMYSWNKFIRMSFKKRFQIILNSRDSLPQDTQWKLWHHLKLPETLSLKHSIKNTDFEKKNGFENESNHRVIWKMVCNHSMLGFSNPVDSRCWWADVDEEAAHSGWLRLHWRPTMPAIDEHTSLLAVCWGPRHQQVSGCESEPCLLAMILTARPADVVGILMEIQNRQTESVFGQNVGCFSHSAHSLALGRKILTFVWKQRQRSHHPRSV